jgi:hypothetical protein
MTFCVKNSTWEGKNNIFYVKISLENKLDFFVNFFSALCSTIVLAGLSSPEN